MDKKGTEWNCAKLPWRFGALVQSAETEWAADATCGYWRPIWP